MIKIVGAGPIGCYLGYLLAKTGKQVEIFEEHSKIGEPVQCTGLVTSDILNIKEIKRPLEKSTINTIYKIKVIAPNNDFFILNLKNPEYVIDRAIFDNEIAEMAKHAGVKIHLNEKILNLNEFKNDLIIGADGPLSIVAKNISNQKKDYYTAIQTRIRGHFQKDTYSIYLGKKFNDFFTWVVPESNEIARVGTASKKSPANQFKNFLQVNFPNAIVLDTLGGLIPVYNPKQKLHHKNLYIVGDSAGQVKATTGGGLIPGFLASKTLSKCISEKKSYKKEIKKIKRHLYLHLQIRKIMNKFTDNDYNELVKMVKQKKIKKILETHSREKPLAILLKLTIKEPRFIKFAPIFFR